MTPTEVKVGCPCPGIPHPEGDIVWLKDEPDVGLFVAFNVTFGAIEGSALTLGEWQADMQAGLANVYLRHGIRAWSFLDGNGEPVPILPSTVARLLPYMKGGKAVVDACDALYTAALLAPFVEAVENAKKANNRELRRRTKRSSPAGRMGRSTSRISTPGSGLRVVSPPSSPTDSGGKPSEVRAS